MSKGAGENRFGFESDLEPGLDGLAGSVKTRFYGRFRDGERFSNLTGRHLLAVAQHEHGAVGRIQGLEGSPQG